MTSNPHNPDMSQTTSTKIGERISELAKANGLTAQDVAEQTGIPYAKLSKWKGDPEKRPAVQLDEAWALAHFFAGKMATEPFKVLLYLTDDAQPDGLARMAVLAAWRGQLDQVTTQREPEVVPVIRERRGEPIPKPRRSRAEAKGKHLPR
jgi:transcriptional regulator with XRE-family HTH domain